MPEFEATHEIRRGYWSALAVELYEDIWVLSTGEAGWTGWICMREMTLTPIPTGQKFKVDGGPISSAAILAQASDLTLEDLTEDEELPELPKQNFFPRIHGKNMLDWDAWDAEQEARLKVRGQSHLARRRQQGRTGDA